MSAIEQEVIDALKCLDDRWESIGTGSASWTREIKNAVGRLGKKHGYEIYAAQSDFQEMGEWIYDLAWFDDDGDITLDMPLVMESEWNPRGILEDFQKLVVSRGKHRIMICWQPTERAWRRCREQLVAQIRRFKGTVQGDRYLLCCWVGEPDSEEELQVELVVA